MIHTAPKYTSVMVQNDMSAHGFLDRPVNRLFYPDEEPITSYPIQSVKINWKRLKAMRSIVLETIHEMPAYLIKPEILNLLDAEKDPTYRLIMDLMWTTGARISEILALRPTSFRDNDCGFYVMLKTLKQRPGRPMLNCTQN